MSPRAIFDRYRREHRDDPLIGFQRETLPMLSRYTADDPGAEGFVVFAELPAGQEDVAIAEQLSHFAGRQQRFEWKVYDFDTPTNLKTLLEERGFVAGAAEAFMVYPVAEWSRAPRLPDGVSIAPVRDNAGIRDFVAVQQATWPEDLSWLTERYSQELRTTPERAALYCAYHEGRPIATGRIDFPPTSFAYLRAGAVIPEFRSRGIFSAIVDRRIREARTRGYAFVAVDAAPMSRPILLKQGFQHVCFTYPMRRPAQP